MLMGARSAPDIDALNRHPSRIGDPDSGGITPGKIVKFCVHNHAILCIGLLAR